MNSLAKQVIAFCLVSINLLSGVEALGQAARTESVTESRVVQGIAEPSFRIEPVIQKLRGRGGDVLGFQFEIQGGGKASTIQVEPVALKQFEDGSILFDPNATIMQDLQIVSPQTFNLEPGQKTKIEGIVTVPRSDSVFHSFGVLVKDEGKLSDNSDVGGEQATRARILFKTQYVLRCDVLVEGKRPDSASVLQLSNASCLEYQGKPVVHVRLNNPANTPYEFNAEIHFHVAGTGGKKRSVKMSTIARRNMQTQDRYTTRILANSEIILEAMPDEFLFPATYDGEVVLSVLGKPVIRQRINFTVPREKFSAQEINLKEVCDGVVAFPIQLVVSHRRGEKRMTSLNLENYSKRARTFTIKAIDTNGLEVKDVKVRPSEITLAAGSQKQISLSMSGTPESRNRYVSLEIASTSIEGEESKISKLNLALLSGKVQPQRVALSPLELIDDPQQPYYRTKVTNRGDAHIPLSAEIIIRNRNTNEEIAFEYGWGRWILPGQDMDLRFPLPSTLTEGNYDIECLLKGLENEISEKSQFTINPAAPNSTAARPSTQLDNRS